MRPLHELVVLVPGKLSPFATDRLSATFKLIEIARADRECVTPEIASQVRAIAASTQITADFIDSLPRLEIIANFGVGYDAVDAAHAGLRGVMVTNTPDVLTEEVADTAIGLLLNTLRELSAAERHLREGRWAREGNYRLTPLTMRGRTVGILGMGRIGRAIARRLEAFDVAIAYHSRQRVEGLAYAYYPALPDLARAVDTLIVVVPGGKATRDAVNKEILKALGPNGVLISIGRGSTVDEEAVAAALSDGTIAAAGLDVFKNEPQVPQSLLDAPNCVLLPHVGSASEHTRKAMADLCVDNLVSWFSGKGAITPVRETVQHQRKL